VQLRYLGNPNTAGKCNKPKSICNNKNTTEITKWLSDCNCNDKGNYVSLPLAKCRTGFWTGLMRTAKNCLGTPLVGTDADVRRAVLDLCLSRKEILKYLSNTSERKEGGLIMTGGEVQWHCCCWWDQSVAETS